MGIILYARSRETLRDLETRDMRQGTASETTEESVDVTVKWDIIEESINEETSEYSLNILYPQITGYTDVKTQTSFNDLVFGEVNSMAKDMKFGESSGGSVKNFLDLDYTVEYKSDRFVSILIAGQIYTGGAHPNPVLLTINYDLDNNSEIKLIDLFKTGSTYLLEISDFTTTSLKDQFEVDFNEDGSSAKAENFTHFTFNQDSLFIIFDAYQVGSYAIGTPKIEIPLSEFSTILKFEFK